MPRCTMIEWLNEAKERQSWRWNNIRKKWEFIRASTVLPFDTLCTALSHSLCRQAQKGNVDEKYAIHASACECTRANRSTLSSRSTCSLHFYIKIRMDCSTPLTFQIFCMNRTAHSTMKCASNCFRLFKMYVGHRCCWKWAFAQGSHNHLTFERENENRPVPSQWSSSMSFYGNIKWARIFYSVLHILCMFKALTPLDPTKFPFKFDFFLFQHLVGCGDGSKWSHNNNNIWVALASIKFNLFSFFRIPINFCILRSVHKSICSLSFDSLSSI